jgi:hypothetical protein
MGDGGEKKRGEGVGEAKRRHDALVGVDTRRREVLMGEW